MLPGQVFTNNVSNFIFGTNMSQDWAAHNSRNTHEIQALIKSGGFTIMRCTIPQNSSDAYIQQTVTACQNMNVTMLVILHHSDLTWNSRLVTQLGNNCNLYEFSNEPDLLPITTSAYQTFWKLNIPTLRGINKNAAFIGPVLGVFSSFDSYVIPWLQDCKNSGILPDAISYHIYPCTGSQWTQSVCDSRATSFFGAFTHADTAIKNILGKSLPICLTEWNIDANSPPQQHSYATDSTFASQWAERAIDDMVAAGYAICNQWDAAGNAGNGTFDVVNTTTFQPQNLYNPIVKKIHQYLTVAPSQGDIAVTPTSLNFVLKTGVLPVSQSIRIQNTTNTSITYAATPSANITLSSVSGGIMAGSHIDITITPSSGLAIGSYADVATLLISTGKTITIPVTEQVIDTSPITPLILYTSNITSTVQGNANQLFTKLGVSVPSNTWSYTRVGKALGFSEISHSTNLNSWKSFSLLGNPTGNGFLLDTPLSGQTLIAGSYSANVRLNCAISEDTNPESGNLTADIYINIYKYNNSNNTYILIGILSLLQSIIPSLYTTIGIKGSIKQDTDFKDNEYLYIDYWPNIMINNNNNDNLDIRFNRLSTDSLNKTGDLFSSIITPGLKLTPIITPIPPITSSSIIIKDGPYQITTIPTLYNHNLKQIPDILLISPLSIGNCIIEYTTLSSNNVSLVSDRDMTIYLISIKI